MADREIALRWYARYGLAAVFVGIAFAFVAGFRQVYPHAYALFLFAVVATAFISGYGAALAATLLSMIGINIAEYLAGAGKIDLSDLIQLAVFATMALTVTSLTAARHRAEMNLERANAELRELDRAKDQFIATITHELKTPITVILGWTGLMRASEDPEMRTAALAAIEQSARAQAQLVEDLLDMSRLILGKLHLQITPTAFVSIVDQSAQMIRPTAAAKNVALVVELSPNPCVVDGDPLRLQQICTNLLSNAVKFTPAGGRVEVRLQCDDRSADLSVSDTGEGIAPDLLPHVFETLRQGKGGVAKGGLGLGLAIVKELVARHHGTIEAHSAGPGKGSRFIVRLPLATQR
ncbi:MAG TPA: HAMP domain-containing sensor histidine kinase [Thermoanaerobaculia bacterium]|nr:HAMP domain-containing sensor histidine kinase [Thermoanaerobaculia bacterium]